MRVLVLSNIYPPRRLGGYEIACSNVVADLRRRGHAVQVVTSPAFEQVSETDVDRGLNCVDFGNVAYSSADAGRLRDHESTVSSQSNSSHLIDALSRFRPDVVYIFNLAGVGALGLLNVCNALDLPWVMHLMDRFPVASAQGKSKRVRSVFNNVDGQIYDRGAVIAMSRNLLDEMQALANVRFRGPVHIVPGWTEPADNPPRQAYRQGGHTRFVSAGAIHEHKGIGLIVDAAARLLSAGCDRFSVDLFGWGDVAHFIELSRKAGTDGHVRFLGSRSQAELRQAYADHDVFLFPTWSREPFGFAPVEAAACGCVPIITGDCGVAERMVGGVHCIKIERTAQSLADAMLSVIDGKVDLPAIARRALALTRSDLAFERCMDRIEQILCNSARAFGVSDGELTAARRLARLQHDLGLSIEFGR